MIKHYLILQKDHISLKNSLSAKLGNNMATNNSINTGKPIEVSNGGTGASTMTTAYAPVISGTTATNPLQVASTGLSTSGYTLKSTGSSSVPSFQPTIIYTVLTAGSGNHTLNANTKVVTLYMWQAGGGGGSGRQGITALSGGGIGGGAGGGGIFWNIPVYAFGGAGTSVAYVVPSGGAGGVAQTASSTNGNTGGASVTNVSFGNFKILNASTASGGGSTAAVGGGAGGTFSLSMNATSGTGSPAAGGNGGILAGGSGNPTNNQGGIVPNPSAGGGGGGANSVTPRAGGSGGAAQSFPFVSVILAGAAGGIETGTINGADGTNASSINYFCGGTGGGGGGGQSVGASAGNGGKGGNPGGGGGGGGGSLNGTNSGAGGDGGDGQITVIEYT